MSVSKITSPTTPNGFAQKINDIIDDKQELLVSGTNIKTINSSSILGSGNIPLTLVTFRDWSNDW